MSCVNTNSKEFKDTVSRLDVHPDNLEAVLHKFLNTEDRFPTDAEIMQELQGKPWITSNYTEILWWNSAKAEKRTVTFGNLVSAMNEYQTNRDMFPTGSTTMYRNSKGEYVVSIGTPILEGLPFAIDEFTIDNVLSTLDGRMYHDILKSIIYLIGKDNIKMKMGRLSLENTTLAGKQNKYSDPLAIWNGSEVVVDPINFKSYLDSRFSKRDMIRRAGEFRRVLTHELIHSFTIKVLDSDISTLSAEELKFRNDIYSLYQEAVSKTDKLSEFYGFEDVREFIAEALSNRGFQMHLATIKSGKGNLWTKMLDIFSRILNKLGVPSNSVLANVLSSTSEFMEYLENKRELLKLADEVAQEEYENIELPPEDFFENIVPVQNNRVKEREKKFESLTQSDRDSLNRIKETDPILYDQVLDGLITIEEANELIKSGEVTPFVASQQNPYEGINNIGEINSIKSKAIADGTFMKAPNGNPTNLNERQWLQVRTKAFKDWFGDWETIAYDKARLNSIPNLRKINVDSFLKAVDSKLEKDYLTKGYLNRESVEVIKKLFDLSKTQLYQGDIKEYGLSFYTGAIVLSTMKMEEAAQVFVHEILHSYTTYAYDTDATFRKEINKYHKIALSHNSGFSKDVYEFMANTLEPGHMATLLEIPSENNSSNLLKDIINSLVKHIRAFFKIYETRGKRTLFHDVIETIYNHKKSNSESINNISKVVDENGEPLVVYHGSKSIFHTFRNKYETYKEEKYLETSEIKKEDLNSFTNKEKNTLIPLINRFEDNPFIALSEFTKSEEELFNKYYDKLSILRNNGKKVIQHYNIGNFFTTDKTYAETYGTNVYSTFLNIRNPKYDDKLHRIYTSDSRINSLQEEGYNGIIGNDVKGRDVESKGKEYVVFNPNQIKSATDNTGEFSTTNDDIRFSRFPREFKDYLDYLKNLGYIHSYKGNLLISTGDIDKGTKLDRINYVKSLITRSLINSGFPVDAITYRDTENGSTLHVEEGSLKDKIERDRSITTNRQELQDVLTSLHSIFPNLAKEIKFLSIRETKQLLGREDIGNAFIKGNQVYVVLGTKVNKSTIIEECLHPFVNSLSIENPLLFSNLLREAKRDFKELQKEIALSYRTSEGFTNDDRNQELVTQVLTRYYKGEIKNPPKTFRNYAKDFLLWFKNMIVKALNRYNVRLNKYEIRPEDINVLASFSDIAKLINLSDTYISVGYDNSVRFSNTENGFSEADAQQSLNYAEAAYTGQEQQSIKKENQSYMERAVTITQQIDNLNNSTALSATEVRHVAEQAVYWISDHITEIQETPGLAEKTYGEKFKDKDFASMSRAEVVRTIGPDAMIAMCKEKFSPENTDYEDFDTMDKAEIITDNWGAIMMLASDVFLSVEDFSIVSSKDGKTSEVNEDLVADADNFNNSNMEGDVLENEGDLQEHWQVETKTLDVLATMSQMVRQALTKCYLLDKDGNNITSEFGINERVNAREATNSILRWTQGALNLEQMITKLQEKSDSNPWVRQIIGRLSDTSGKEADFQGQFFGTFCKHFQPYSVVIEEKGRYKSIQVNENPALSEAMTQVTTQYKIGEHPLFTTEGINKDAFKELKSAFEELGKYNHQGYDLTNTETRDEAARTLGYISNLLGYYVTPEMVAENLNKDTFKRMYSALRYITNSLEKNLDNATYEPFKFGSRDGINGNTREFLKPITDHLEDIAVSAFYDSGKMYQSYITPSYTSKLFQKFGQTGKAFDDFIMAEYGNMPWFHTGNNIERGWRNAWLKSLATDSKAREIFKHKVQLNFNKHNYMRNMSDMEYALSLFTEYFSENASEKQTRVPAWFRVPMLSNKPSSEFIRFYSERGTNYREALTNGFKMIFDQELSRIQTVEMRNLSKSDPRFIKNFDSNGKKFMFLDFMNEYLTGDKKSSELGKLIRQKLDGRQVDEARLNELAKEVIMQTIEARAESIVTAWEAQGILKGAEKVANIGTTEEEVRENLKNFVWNDTFAAMNIMQLTITDLAFYKDAEDLQKRLAQIHAPGVRGNAKATDYEGRPVTDGNFRTIKLTDFDTFISNIIDNVSVVFDRRVASAPESEKAALRTLKDSLVGKDGAFRQINVADAQGYSSPTSYRKKALVFGKWSRQAEEIYQRLKKGTYTYNDLKVAFQPLKPFVYSQTTKDAGVKGAPLGKMKVPVQYKNSEYLLIMADAILQGENTGKPNLLRAIFNVMEESHYDSNGNYKTDGIDTAQFESTVKSGLMGKINLNDLVNNPNGEAIAKARMEAAIYEATPKEVTEVNPETGAEETKTIYERTGTYNNSTVDTVPFEDYCLQQEVPEHFKEHEQAHGSQLRYIIVSELENFNYLGEPVTYNIEGRQVTAQEFKAEYESTIAENIQESIDELAEELSLNNLGSIKDRNIALSKILQREILSSPRYGVDLLQACSVDENGRFRIPLGDPIQSKRVEQLINSIIKNRVNKQKLPGGPVVQVTNFGTSKELNIRFKDKSGNLLMTRAEYEKNPIKKEISQADKFNTRYRKGAQASEGTMSYEDYIKENQAGIAYFEVFAPIYSNQLFTQFADKNGVINIQALEMLDPDLLKMIGYRIPTEDKYSMAPLKIVGFLPREAGDGIMLPNDITLLTGSDFDVDKEYLMRKDYSIKRTKLSKKEIFNTLYRELVDSQSESWKKVPRMKEGGDRGKYLTELGKVLDRKEALKNHLKIFMDDPFDSTTLDIPEVSYNKLLKRYLELAYSVKRPTEGRTYRNNKIVDMTYEVLTHETSADKMLNPGGFDQQKRMGYLVSAYKMHSDQYTWEQLQGMSIPQLKDLNNSSKNLSYIDTHIQFYKQNSAAGALIGIFAVNRIAHAVLESGSADGSSTYLMNVDNVCKITRNFTVAGMEFGGYMPFDMRYDRNGQLIGKVMGSLVASAADAVKDPVLNLMNINSNTANILNTLVRLGMPFDNAALFLSQSVISDVLADFSRENITGYMSLSKVIQNKLNDIKNETGIDESSDINKEELTYEELVEGLKPNAKPEIAYKTLVAFGNFQKIAETMKMPTFATRFNSMSSAVGPLIIDNLITEQKIQKLSLESNIVDTNLDPVDMSNIFLGHPILNQFQRTIDIARQLFVNMPANSTGFRNILDLVNELPLSSVIFGDRKLLSSLSDFYQSYLVMKNGVVNPQELGSTITEFPKEFMEKEYKKKYVDNALIQAIKYGTDKSGRATLQVDITGLDTQQKEKLSSAWIDLHKVNPELSIKLFNYNFFRGGISFSPKTFMSLVPVYVKERIPGYVDTFRVLPTTVPETVLDQFIRNNWDNNRLVPRKKATFKQLPNGHVEVFRPSEVRDFTGIQYFKTKVNGKDKLFMQILEKDESIEFKEIAPLGSNKEYLEMSESTIDSPLNVPTEAKVETTEAEVGKENELSETEVSAETEQTERIATDETRLNDLLYKILVIEGVRNEEQAGEYIRNYQAKSEADKAKMERQTKKFFETRFKKLGIEFNSKLIDDIYKLIC